MSGAPWSPARHFALFASSLAVLALRDLSWFLPGHLPHEDGDVLFHHFYQRADAWDLLHAYAGYVSMAPNVLAALLVELPTAWVPPAFALTATAIHCACISAWFLPRFRSLVPSDGVRAATCLTIAALPLGNGVLLHALMFTPWSMLIAATWFALVPRQGQGRAAFALETLFLLLTIASTPIAIVLAPLWAWNVWRAETAAARWQAVLFLVAAALYPLSIDVTGSGEDLEFQGGVHAAYALREWIPTMGGRVFFEPFFGNGLRMHLIWWGAPWLVGFVGWGLAIVAAVWFRPWRARTRDAAGSWLAIAYVLAAFTFASLATRFGAAPIDPSDWFHHRYFHVQQCTVLAVGLGFAFSALRRRWPAPVVAVGVALIVVVTSGLDRREFWSEPWPVEDGQVSAFVSALEACERGEASCAVPISLIKTKEGWDWSVHVDRSRFWPNEPRGTGPTPVPDSNPAVSR